jgi:triosephosphate isomerase (TIM)
VDEGEHGMGITERLVTRVNRGGPSSGVPVPWGPGSRKPLISGNWKMNHTHLDAINVVQKLAYRLDEADYDATDVSVHPSFTALRSVQTLLDADRIPISLGAQNVYWEDHGAFTGEVSPVMLAKLNVAYVIVGHSERRRFFGETDADVNRKVHAVVNAGMVPIVCVGESAEERDAGRTEERVLFQVNAALARLAPEAVAATVLAYEPLWAIGKGRSAPAEEAQVECALIRSAIAADFGGAVGDAIRIQYGGSVNGDSAPAILAMPDIDGALVGGASLDADLFARVVTATRDLPRRRGVAAAGPGARRSP